MLRIGLTGGIGSGKTAASDIFKRLGIPIIDADVISHDLTQAGNPAIQSIRTEWGDTILQPDGHLDRSRLREQVFKQPEELEKLEAILHPLIFEEIDKHVQHAKKTKAAYCIIVIPLLFEKNLAHLVDKTIVIDISERLQIERVMQRDSLSEKQVSQIMAQQCDRTYRLKQADYVIENTKTTGELESQIQALDLQLRSWL